MLLFENDNIIDDLNNIEYDLYKNKNQNTTITLDDYKKTTNAIVSILSSKDNKSKLKDPNFLVKILRWFRGLYRNIMIKYSHPLTIKDKNFIQKLIGRILRFIDRIMLRLEKLVDRRTFEQISNEEKLNKRLEYLVATNKDFKFSDEINQQTSGKYRFSKDINIDKIDAIMGIK